MRRRYLLATALATATIGTLMSATADAQAAMDPENTLYMDLKDGRVVIRLRPDLAPKHVERVKALARRHFYDGTPFHRVIEGFMAPASSREISSSAPRISSIASRESWMF